MRTTAVVAIALATISLQVEAQGPRVVVWSEDCAGNTGYAGCAHSIGRQYDGRSSYNKAISDGHVALGVSLSVHGTSVSAWASLTNVTSHPLDVFASSAVLRISPIVAHSDPGFVPATQDVAATDPHKFIRSIKKDAAVQSTIVAVAGVRTTTDATVTDSNGKTHDVTVESRDPVATGRLIDQIHQNATQQASAYLLDQTVEPGASVQGWIAFYTNTKRISTATFQMTIGATTFQFPFAIDAKTHVAH